MAKTAEKSAVREFRAKALFQRTSPQKAKLVSETRDALAAMRSLLANQHKTVLTNKSNLVADRQEALAIKDVGDSERRREKLKLNAQKALENVGAPKTIAAMRTLQRNLESSPEAALAFLVKAGIVTPKGKLRRLYR